MRVAFQGELGAFSEEAVRTFFGDKAEPVPRREFRDVGQAVASGEVEFGALPVENTLAGGVGASYDVLAREALTVIGEVIVPVHLCVLGVPGSNLGGLRRVLSHPVALGQAVRFFESRPNVEAVAVYDTAGAAREVVKLGEPSTAALASRGAAERYGLTILAENVEDRPDNQTRFLIIAPSASSQAHLPLTSPPSSLPGASAASPPSPLPAGEGGDRGASWKTTVLLETPNEPGALVRALQCFAERGINLSKLESRPADVPWTYRFFLEFDTERESRGVEAAFDDLAKHSTSVRVLGSYPKATAAGIRIVRSRPATTIAATGWTPMTEPPASPRQIRPSSG
jgi:prephenate dehydratase